MKKKSYENLQLIVHTKFFELRDLKDPKDFRESLETGLEFTQQSKLDQSLKIELLKQDPSFLKSIWVPTKETLATKSRKDIQINLNKISKVLELDALTPNQTSTLNWVHKVIDKRFNEFKNPFSWHESTGHPERIQNESSLDEYLKDNGTNN